MKNKLSLTCLDKCADSFYEPEGIQIANADNMGIYFPFFANLIYADMIYENPALEWIPRYWSRLQEEGVFIIQTDYHTVAKIKLLLDELDNAHFINWVIYKQEWGGVPQRGFAQKHDDILIYSKGKDFKWYGNRIQIPKATAGIACDKRGTGLKTPCSVFDDLGNFSTVSRERVKNDEGKNIRWQKPMKLMDRLLLPFTDEGDLIIDPFMGSGTTGLWCLRNNRRFFGIELDQSTYEIAKNRLVEEVA